MKTVAIGIIGYGTVGQGVVEVLARNAREIERRSGYQLQVKRVAKRSWQGIDTSALPFACDTDPFAIASDPDIGIVIELAGGEHPAFEIIKTALEHDKHVITANKALIARGRVFCFAVQLPDKPGQLLHVSQILAEEDANVIRLDHNQAMVTDSFKKVQLTVTCETHDEDHIRRIIAALQKGGFIVERVY